MVASADTAPLPDDESAEAVERLAVLLGVGVAPSSAWTYLAEQSAHPVVGQVARGIAAGSPPGEALAAAARGARRTSPAIAWRTLAAEWTIADVAGAPLAPALRGLAAGLRDAAETAREIQVALAAPMSTARLVGWLPIAGLAIGWMMGADVIAAVTGSVTGLSTVLGGVLLTVAGRLWSAALVRSASPPPTVPGIAGDMMAVALSGGMSAGHGCELSRDVAARFALGAIDFGSVGTIELARRADAPAGGAPPERGLLGAQARPSRGQALRRCPPFA